MKAALSKALMRLPRRLRARLFRSLMNDEVVSYEGFLTLAHRFNVSEIAVQGDYGTFRSTAGDASILGAYARTGTWAAETNAAFAEFFARHAGGTYIDIGANIGLTTVPIARNPRVRCIARSNLSRRIFVISNEIS